MTRKQRLVFLVAIAFLAGAISSEFFYRSVACRNAIGVLFGRGDLLAIAHGRAFYESDVAGDVNLEQLITAENLRHISGRQEVEQKDVAREFQLLRSQFGKEQTFTNALRASSSSTAALRAEISRQLQAGNWAEKRIVGETTVDEAACRAFYDSHGEQFTRPARWRASHLFLIAPAGTPPEVVEAKRSTIESLRTRILRGENFAGLVSEFSEDEATKLRGGDLGVFSSWRIPPDFIAETAKLEIGKVSKAFPSRLGYHILRTTEARPPDKVRFEEALPEIAAALANAMRRKAVAELAQELNKASYIRTAP